MATPPRLPHARVTGVLIGAALPALALGGCGGGATDQAAGTHTVTVTLTDGGCAAGPGPVPAGPTTFTVTNRDAARVTELEVLSGDRVLGEKENLAPGMSGSFSLRLTAGAYTFYCPGAKNPRTAFTVTADPGTAAATTVPPAAGGALRHAVDAYRSYVQDQATRLAAATRTFAAAVRAGDVDAAKRLYAPTRTFYERIEPVAESFGDLDPAIDARINDVENPATWTGFHRIEQALWERNTTDGMAPVAQRLVSDVDTLRGLVGTADYQPAQLANGASELLDEVAKSKITGEEERYSHTDLVDFAANIDGARTAFDLLHPALEQIDPALATTVSGRLAAVEKALDRHRDGAGYVAYTTLSPADVRALAGAVDALAEPLSQVAAAIVGHR